MTTQNKPQGVTLREAQAALEKLLECTLEEFGESYETVRKYLSQPTEPVQAMPEAAAQGWKLVPVAPTPEMVSAGMQYCAAGNVYRAMLSASPAAPEGAYSHADVAQAHTDGYRLGLAQLDRPAAPEAAKPEQQAQAGEPEVVAKIHPSYIDLLKKGVDATAYPPDSSDSLEPLITLQSHREAIAKKDAALQACVEALIWEIGSERQLWDKKTAAAITQAQEALK